MNELEEAMGMEDETALEDATSTGLTAIEMAVIMGELPASVLMSASSAGDPTSALGDDPSIWAGIL